MFPHSQVRALLLFVVGLLALAFVVATLARIREGYRLQTDVALLTERFQAHVLHDVAEHAQLAQTLAQMRATLYGERTLPKRQPSTVEVWQKNRDAELRRRIAALEQWRYKESR